MMTFTLGRCSLCWTHSELALFITVFQQAMPFTLQSVAELREISYKDGEMNCGEPHSHALNPCQDFVSYTQR